jgi:GH15 family glucan-1,4-alpha-glucosidase
VGYCDARSEKFLATRKSVIDELSSKGMVFRYPPGSDGIAEPEGSFAICGFWLAESFVYSGDAKEAEAWFESIACRANSCGLLAEEMDPVSEGFLGNFPQGFSHIGLINAATAIERGAA